MPCSGKVDVEAGARERVLDVELENPPPSIVSTSQPAL